MKSIVEILLEVEEETRRAITIHTAFNSNHEGYAALLEEVDELWAEIKKNSPKVSTEEMRQEALQVAAMATRFVFDRCNPT